MKKAFFLRTVMLLWLCCLFSLLCVKAAANDTAVEQLLPQSMDVTGWQRAGELYRYLPENLYEYINGAADLFLSYGCKGLTGAQYAPVSESRENVIVDIYDMGNTLNAFGIFQAKRDPDSDVIPIGTGACGNEQYLFFYKGHVYVEIQTFNAGGTADNLLKQTAQAVSKRIAADSSPPDELCYLPATGRVPGSERYITGGILGHAFLGRGLIGDYRIGEETVKAFVAFLPLKQDAAAALDTYRAYVHKAGKKWKSLPGFGEQAFVARDPYHRTILVARQGRFVAGLANLSQDQTGEALLRRLIEQIKNHAGQ